MTRRFYLPFDYETWLAFIADNARARMLGAELEVVTFFTSEDCVEKLKNSMKIGKYF